MVARSASESGTASVASSSRTAARATARLSAVATDDSTCATTASIGWSSQRTASAGTGRPSQQGQIVRPVPRTGEQRLEEQVLQQVVTPHVEQEGNVGAGAGDVREALVRPHADVGAAAHAEPVERAHDVQVAALVRDEIVGVEVATRLRELGDGAGERRIAERGEPLRAGRGARPSRVARAASSTEPAHGATAAANMRRGQRGDAEQEDAFGARIAHAAGYLAGRTVGDPSPRCTPSCTPMALLALQDVSIAFGGPPVLGHANLAIERGDRVCLLGRNGAGKSTLLQLLDGTQQPDGGEIVRQGTVVVSRLQQDVPDSSPARMFDVGLERAGRAGGAAGALPPGRARPSAREASDRALRELDRLHQAVDAADAWQLNTRVTTVLEQLGLDPDAPSTTPRAGASARRCWRARWCGSPTCCCSTSPPTISTSPPSSGSRRSS